MWQRLDPPQNQSWYYLSPKVVQCLVLTKKVHVFFLFLGEDLYPYKVIAMPCQGPLSSQVRTFVLTKEVTSPPKSYCPLR